MFFKAPPLEYFLNGLSEPPPKAMPKRPAAHHPLAFSATHAEQQDRQLNAPWRRVVLPRISTQSSDCPFYTSAAADEDARVRLVHL